MATQPDDDEPLELTEELQVPENGPGRDTRNDDDDRDGRNDEDDQNPDDPGEEQPSVSFEGEEPPPEENSVIREFRKREREKDKRIAELEKSSAPKPVEIGEEPTLEGCDYDGDRYKEELRQYDQRKAAADAQASQAAEANREAQESWATAKQRYDAKVAEYGFTDIKADEALVEGALGINSPVILKAVRDPAAMIRALGSHPGKLAELAKIKDPFELAGELARMEGAVKVTRKAPNPDRAQRGSAPMPSGSDKELERLEKEADRTGDRTAFIAAKRARKEAAKDK